MFYAELENEKKNLLQQMFKNIVLIVKLRLNFYIFMFT